MNYLFFNRKSLLAAALLGSAIGMNAQIESTHTDEKFGYTTVVYKDKAATDSEVLSALDNSIGMGDVVRVTVAPPKPAAAPAIDKSKGEDIWLKASKVPVNTLTASTPSNPAGLLPAKAPAAAPKPAAPAVAKAAPAAAKPVVKNVATTPGPVVAPVQNQAAEAITAAPKTVKTKTAVSAKSSKSSKKAVKKSVRKGNSTFKMKSRKKGKQRYSCPKF